MKILITGILMISLFLGACKSPNNLQKGTAIGSAGGAVVGAAVGSIFGKVGMGAIIGATVGGVTGAVIGRNMDKQAEEIRKNLPDAQVIRVGEGIEIEFSSKILFGVDQSDLSTAARSSLDKLINVLKAYPDTDIEVQGHTDNTGTESYNQSLSKRRASSVSGYLSSNGVGSSRLNIKGFGETAPKYTNSTAEGQEQNRRVEFLITANEKMKADAAKEAEKNGGK
ncbi:MAG: OmpA family protein [Bacteroidota bacterium]